jgi:starch synthase
MAVGIRLADRVHTVSASYAQEIRQPSRKPQFYGGEGLEADLERVHRDGRLIGILNGCRYPGEGPDPRIGFDRLLNVMRGEVIRWSGDVQTVPAAQFVAFARILEWDRRREKPDMLLTAVARAGEQKMRLLLQSDSDGKPALEAILEGIGERGRGIILGSGDRGYETFLTAVGARHENFIFLNGYSEKCARALYAAGDLFLMPSSFEPCGLSQMLAMRAGQPCLVHAVGGLKDTVRDGHNGFTFGGDTLVGQTNRFIQTTLAAVALKRANSAVWDDIRRNAAATRFSWDAAADRYVQELYGQVSVGNCP